MITRALVGRLRRCHGLSLIELMVAIALGILTVLAMMQLRVFFESDKRSTTGGADAQNIGVVALYGLQRDIRESGFGISSSTLFTCNVSLTAGGVVPVVPLIINPPTSLVPAGDANTDTLLVFYGNANWAVQGNVINSQSGNDYVVQSPGMFTVGDQIMAVPDTCAGNLSLRAVTAVTATTVTAPAGNGTTLYNLGAAPSILAYAVRDGNLTVCNYMTTNCSIAKASLSAADWALAWVPIASNVVSMRAQYGIDTSSPMDAVVDAYSQTTPSTACGWAKVSAARLALVARNPQFNKTDVTAAAPTWDGTAGAPIVLTSASDWQRYRYRTFQVVVPIRNMVWLGVQSGC